MARSGVTLGEHVDIGPYRAWRPAREGILDRYLAVRRDDDERKVVDLLTALVPTFDGPVRGLHPSVPLVLDEGTFDKDARWWARTCTEGVTLATFLARTSREGARVDTEMAGWLVEQIIGAALAVRAVPNGEWLPYPALGHVVVRFTDGRPVMLRFKPRCDDDREALEWPLRPSMTDSPVALLSLCLDARAPLGAPFAQLPDAIRKALDDAEPDASDRTAGWRALADALMAMRTSDTVVVMRAWHGAVHALFPEEGARFAALVEEMKASA